MKKLFIAFISFAAILFTGGGFSAFAATSTTPTTATTNTPTTTQSNLKIIPFKRTIRPLDRASRYATPYNSTTTTTSKSSATPLSASSVGVAGGLEGIPAQLEPLYQQDKYSVNLFTGTVTYNYPFKFPKGTNDVTPSLSLNYSHQSAHDPSMYAGSGWELDIPYISTNVQFDPLNPSGFTYQLHFNGQTQDLIFVSSENRYHTKIESNLFIQRTGSGGQNNDGVYWTVTTKDGTVYRFGYQTQSELPCNGQTYQYKWVVDQVQDLHNNHLYYSYQQSNGQIYLTKISYNNDTSREADLNYTTNTYQKQYYIQGCSITETNLLNSVQVKTNSKLVHEYDMAMTQSVNGQNLLSSITEKGSDGSSLPPTKFTYNPVTPGFSSQQVNFAQADLNTKLSDPNTQMCDMTGNGRPDIVQSPGTGGGTWNVHINRGDHFDTNWTSWGNIPASLSDQKVRLLNVDGSGRCDVVQSINQNNRVTYQVWLNNGSQFTGPYTWVSVDNNNNQNGLGDLSQTSVTLLDIRGIGLPDIVSNGRYGWEILRNTGSSWESSWTSWSTDSYIPNFSWSDVRVFGVTGDGLPDIVQSSDNGNCYVSWHVWKNNGHGFVNGHNFETWINNAQVCVRNDRPDTAIADVYGNGLPELMQQAGVSNNWTIQSLKNTGTNWSTTFQSLLTTGTLSQDFADTKFVDTHGNGLVDVLYTPQTWQWYVYSNQGYAPDTLASVTTPQGATTSYQYVSSTTFNNNGNLPFPVWVVSKVTVDNGMTNTQHTQDTKTYTYSGGMYAYQQREFRGFQQVTETEPDGSVQKSVFAQDDGLKGSLTSKTTTDNSGNTYASETSTYTSTQTNGVYTNLLTSKKEMTYDGQSANPVTRQTDYSYDQYGNVTQTKDYDFSGNVLGTTNTTYTYNPSLWLVNKPADISVNTGSGTKVSETFTYYDGSTSLTAAPAKGDVTQETKWLSGGTNPTTTYTYDSYGNQTKVTDANNHTTQTAYDSTGTYPTQMTNAKNQATTVSYDLGTGNLLSKTDPNNFTTSYTYDPFGRVLSEIDPGDTSSSPTIQNKYFDTVFPQGTLQSKRVTSGGTTTFDTYTFVDGSGRTIQSRSPLQNSGQQMVTDTWYGANGKVSKQSVSHSDTLTSAYASPVSGIETTQYTYDPLLRVTQITNPSGTTKTYAFSHILTPAPQAVVTETDENGNANKKYFDVSGNIVEVDQTVNSQTYPTLYTYDVLNNLLQIKDSQSHLTQFTYDTLNRKVSVNDPDMGQWQYGYDAVGNLLTRTDGKGTVTAKTYDELNRVTQVKFPNDILTGYIYDGGTIGTLTTKLDSAGSVDYTYDNRLRKTQEKRTIDSTAITTQYAYDDMDHVISQTNPDGETVQYAYNPQGELGSLSAVASIVKNIDYNPLGQVTDRQLANGITTNYSYNSNDFRLNRIQTGTTQDLNYSYDTVGNVTGITDNILNTKQTFGYDTLYRLTSAQQTNGYNQTFVYDDIGNMTKFVNNGSEIDYTYGQSAGVHAMTSSTETLPTPTPNPTPTATPTPTVTPTPGIPSPWTDTDIGQPAVAGSASYTNGTFTVNGAGSDIWNSTDQFNYVYQPLTGDGNIIARVTSQTNTDPWAKAGVMIKESASTNAKYVLAAVTPGNGLRMQYTFTNDLSGGSFTFPNAWLKVSRAGNTFTTAQSTDGTHWTTMGSTSFTMNTNATVGLFVTSHNGGQVSTATFDNITVTGPLPSGWSHTDIGSPAIGGSSSYNAGTFTVNGAGNDIWQSNDQFQYAYQPITGDTAIIARILSQTNTDPWAKAGVMIKESATANANYVLFAATPSNGLRMQYTFTNDQSAGAYSFPQWVKLVRTGNVFTAYTSPDGTTWTQTNQTTVSMNANATAGLFVTSHNGGQLGTATFDTVSLNANGVTPTPTPSSTPTPTPTSCNNLVSNPSFETPTAGNTTVPTSWNAYNTAGSQTYKGNANDFANDGNQSFKISATANTDTGIWTQISGLTIGQPVSLSVFVQTDANVTNASVVLDTQQMGIGGTLTKVMSIGANNSGRVSINNFVPDKTAVNIFLGLGSFGAQSIGKVWYDSVKLETGTSSTSYCPVLTPTPSPTPTPTSSSIQLDGTIQSTHNTGGNITLSNFPVTASNANRFLLVAVGSHQGGVASGVTYGGAAMTKLAEQIGQYGEFVQFWGLQAPVGGTGNIVTSGISSGDMTFIAAYSLYNVKQTYTVKTNTLSQSSNTSSVSITPNSANNWIIDAIEAEPVPSVSGSNVQDWSQDGLPNSYDNGNGSRLVQSGGPTAVTLSWHLSYGGRSNQAAVALESFGN